MFSCTPQSFNEIFKQYEQRTGKKIVVEYVPKKELEAAIEKNPDDFVALFHLHLARGDVLLPRPLSNDVFPGWNPKPVIDYIAPVVA